MNKKSQSALLFLSEKKEKKIPYPLTNMSLDFSPVKMSSSSRTTSSVFHTITLSSNLSMMKTYFEYKIFICIWPKTFTKCFLLLWLPRWNINSWSRCRHILREHVHPHLNSPLHHKHSYSLTVHYRHFVIWQRCFWDIIPDLLNPRFIRIQERPCLHVLWNQLAAYSWNFFPAV